MSWQKKEREDEEKRKKEKLASALNKKRSAYKDAHEAIAKETDSQKWTMTHLRALTSYKKQKTDEWALPKTRPLLLQRWLEVKDHISPSNTPIRRELPAVQHCGVEREDDSVVLEIEQTAL